MSDKVVIYIGGFELPDKNAAAHRVLSNAKILRELGYKTVFIGVTKDGSSVCRNSCEGFDSISVPYPKGTKQWIKYLCDKRVFEETLSQYENVEGVIFYNFQSAAMARIMRLCKKKKIWTVADVTEWYVADKKNAVFYMIKQTDTFLRMRCLQNRVSGVIAISSFLAGYYKRKVPVLQLPPLIDKAEDKWKLKDREKAEGIRLVYAGTIGALKDNIKLILVNLTEFKECIKLYVVGASREDILKYLSEDEQKELLGDNIIFLGRRPHKECLQLISDSDFQIFLREDNLVTRAGFPTKLGESFACGTPVITNLSSNIGDYIINGDNGFIIESLEKESVRKALKQVSELRPDDIEKMKIYCRNMQEFDYHYYIDDMREFIQKISKNDCL